MNPAELLEELAARGIGLEAAGDKLLIHAAPGAVTDADRDRIRSHKPALLASLTMPSESELYGACKAAVTGTELSARQLARWIIAQRDPGWCRPAALERWARYAAENGGLPA